MYWYIIENNNVANILSVHHVSKSAEIAVQKVFLLLERRRAGGQLIKQLLDRRVSRVRGASKNGNT